MGRRFCLNIRDGAAGPNGLSGCVLPGKTRNHLDIHAYVRQNDLTGEIGGAGRLEPLLARSKRDGHVGSNGRALG